MVELDTGWYHELVITFISFMSERHEAWHQRPDVREARYQQLLTDMQDAKLELNRTLREAVRIYREIDSSPASSRALFDNLFACEAASTRLDKAVDAYRKFVEE